MRKICLRRWAKKQTHEKQKFKRTSCSLIQVLKSRVRPQPQTVSRVLVRVWLNFAHDGVFVGVATFQSVEWVQFSHSACTSEFVVLLQASWLRQLEARRYLSPNPENNLKISENEWIRPRMTWWLTDRSWKKSGSAPRERRAKSRKSGAPSAPFTVFLFQKMLLPFVTFDEIALKFVLDNRAEVLKIRNIWNDVPTM